MGETTQAGSDRIGDYVIEHELPTTGASSVYAARHAVLPRRVLLKAVPPHLVERRPLAVQMMREACILEALRHPGVPRVYECGTIEGRSWIALELVTGENLERELETTKRLPASDVIALIANVAEVLAHAHARGVVHRDITPATIRRGDGRRGFPVCVTDWSEARIHDTSAPDAAQQLHYYRAPEVISCTSCDAPADVFALGVVAYEALTGQLPALPIPRRWTTAPAALTRLIDHMLAMDPTCRPSAVDVCDEAHALAEHGDDSMVAAMVSAVSAGDSLGHAVIQAIDDVVLLEDISHDAIPEPVAARERPKWTPPWPLASDVPAEPGRLFSSSQARTRRDDT
jgi:serine/threonine-protein kinase